ncbi:hypothetical protein AAG570_010827 [Ranatra chinensis]|uniref:Reverse transcriptase RNase H-like domain-containing protein n=1 Tax=Ranatra chinensis TaxID=642074 RepID=A0ABD0YKY2_9HEMI
MMAVQLSPENRLLLVWRSQAVSGSVLISGGKYSVGGYDRYTASMNEHYDLHSTKTRLLNKALPEEPLYGSHLVKRDTIVRSLTELSHRTVFFIYQMDTDSYVAEEYGSSNGCFSCSSQLKEIKEKNKLLLMQVEDLKQKLADSQGDIKVLRREKQKDRLWDGCQICCDRKETREVVVRRAEEAAERANRLERDLRDLLDEKEELVTERDAYRSKLHRMNHQLAVALSLPQGTLDIDALIMENRYLQERFEQAITEKELSQQTLSKYKYSRACASTRSASTEVDDMGIAPTAGKVKAILDFPKPTTVKELQRFLGMLNFYRRCIPHAADTLSGGSGLLPAKSKKNDRSPLAWTSETNLTYDGELHAIYLAVHHFRPLLEGRQFQIHMDDKPLTFAFRQPHLNAPPRRTRQLTYISQFTTDIRFLAGSDNSVTDGLSRIGKLRLPNSLDAITQAQKSEESTVTRLLREHVNLKWLLLPGVNYNTLCDTSMGTPRVYLPTTLRQSIIL